LTTSTYRLKYRKAQVQVDMGVEAMSIQTQAQIDGVHRMIDRQMDRWMAKWMDLWRDR
jgi:phage tail tube protein FII